jgi:D-alanyl-D-alanine carboxypeptidase/D-alanyl-D-alanine-endopeptidase (penicillin-binding protein 4)
MRLFASWPILIFLLLAATPSLAQQVPSFPTTELSKFLQDSRARYRDSLNIGVHVREERSGREVFTYHGNQTFIPASVAKVVTSVAALKMLGSNYRFPTEVFVERKPFAGNSKKTPPGSVGRMYIRGYGDPSFVREDLLLLARNLKEQGVTSVSDIVADASLFVDARGPIGPRPYESGLSALSLSHNCYEVLVVPTSSGSAAQVVVTPGANVLLQSSVKTGGGDAAKIEYVQAPESKVVAANLQNGVIDAFRAFAFPEVRLTVRGTIGAESEAEHNYFTVPSPALYFVSALKAELQAVGVEVTGGVQLGEVPESADLLHTVKSKDLSQILRDLNFYSNNFTAEQLLFALGQDNVGFFRKELALERLAQLLTSIGLDAKNAVIKDGSGLDRENKLSPEHLSGVLSYAASDYSIAPDFVASLSRYGKTGTLKERKLGKAEGRRGVFMEGGPAHSVWGKTGTLTGVSSLVGYVEAKNKNRYAFAILINGSIAKDAAVTLEDSIVRIVAGL